MANSLLSAVSEVARAAGAMAFARWRGEFASWDKVPGEIVCEIDLAANDMLRAALGKLDPEAGWFSEETADSAERLMRSRVWVVDPIDGTRDFVRGRPGWAVSVALVEGGRAMLGVLDAPARGEHWAAELGKGATLNGVPVHTRDRTQLAGARVPAEILPKADSDLTMVFRPNSIALRMAMVANGEADLLAATRWGHEWDIAAAALIAQEAGATVTDARGQTLRFNSTKGEMFGVLCCAPGIHAAAVERLRERAAVAVLR
ncbi:3'(2'),5'-bisphosphate nucleotidase CysQ [Sphingomonas paeninsulae]|uniref:3'(2'),5'-bisphosphate nucleotidase CysQ n=1 Tax=Sphingomonas paeninsulae TaxID=2319844 RepID=A0A494TKB0_SPHPE|nr:inositol monophosphatase family protein [Sphingomonas paeninsulae]AYJ87964.1 3'(2'),5'-bisphosphate nucleotidase CysQ [Sphingomonas paeninsulae]